MLQYFLAGLVLNCQEETLKLTYVLRNPDLLQLIPKVWLTHLVHKLNVINEFLSFTSWLNMVGIRIMHASD